MILTVTPKQYIQIQDAVGCASRDLAWNENIWIRALTNIFGEDRVKEMIGRQIEVFVDWSARYER